MLHRGGRGPAAEPDPGRGRPSSRSASGPRPSRRSAATRAEAERLPPRGDDRGRSHRVATTAALTLRLLTIATVTMRQQRARDGARGRGSCGSRPTRTPPRSAPRPAQEAEALRKDADTHAHAVLADAEQVRAHAHTVGRRRRSGAARAEAAHAIAAAEEQTAWTQETMQALLATAEQEAERLRIGRPRRRRAAPGGPAGGGCRPSCTGSPTGSAPRWPRPSARREELSGVAASLVAAAESRRRRGSATRPRRPRAPWSPRPRTRSASSTSVPAAARRRPSRRPGCSASQQVAEEVVRHRQSAQDELRRARQEAAEHLAAARVELMSCAPRPASCSRTPATSPPS